MLQLSQINIYPVKSLDGYSPQSARVERQGLQYDRRWMITDLEGRFMTQRTHGKMALLRATLEAGHLVISEKQKEANRIAIPINPAAPTFSEVVVWNDTVQAASTTPEANAWLSDFLGKKCRLVALPDASERRVDAAYNRGGDIVSFADGYPFLLLGEASMRDLNNRLEEKGRPAAFDPANVAPLSIRRFRANFIFSGGRPYQEDSIADFRIGEVDFTGVKNCARCVLITRDPDTGEAGHEPLATLATYRQKGNKVLFGQNAVWNYQSWQGPGLPEVKVGDLLTVKE